MKKNSYIIMIKAITYCSWIIGFLFFLRIVPRIIYAYPPGWSDDILLTFEDNNDRYDNDLDVDQYNNIWATWDSAHWANGTAEILYKKIDSTGTIVTNEIVVSNNPSYSIHPRIVVDHSDCVHFVWRDISSQGLGIWHACIDNNGVVLVPAHLCVSGTGSTMVPSIEISIDHNQNIHVAWEEVYSGHFQMVYSKLDTSGNAIIERIRVTPSYVNAYYPGIGVDSFGNSHLACRTDSLPIGDRLTYYKLDSTGTFFIYNRVLASGLDPSIVADCHQNIHIVYSDPTGWGNKIDYLKLDQAGNIVIGPRTISLPSIRSNLYGELAIDSLQYLHAVWAADSESEFSAIMYTKMDTLGEYVIPPMKIVHSPYTTTAFDPKIAIDYRNRIHVVWSDARSNVEDKYYKYSPYNVGDVEEKQPNTGSDNNLGLYPNPFNKLVKIFSAGVYQGPCQIEIYDISGCKIRRLIMNNSSIIWDGTDDKGNELTSGIYFLYCGQEGIIKKLIKLK